MSTLRAPLGVVLPYLHASTHYMEDLRYFYERQTLNAIIHHSLGLDSISGTTGLTGTLIDHTVVIGIDTEAWTRNTNEMTEIGLAVYERKDMMDVHNKAKLWKKPFNPYVHKADHLGPFGEELLRKISFYHLRIVENAHLKTDAKWMKGADGNRFGHSRFVTFAEARAILDTLFNQTIISDNPNLNGCKKPIILVGHAISHDRNNCRNNGLDFDWFKHGTVVKEIDTQPLAKETYTWFDPATPNNDVGLEKLTRILGYEHTDPHTACNDAARTLIAAIQMVLPRQCKNPYIKYMQEVALDLEIYSRNSRPPPTWGTALFCTRCGGRDHEDKEGRRCTVPVHCKACAQHDQNSEHGSSSSSQAHPANNSPETEEQHWTTHIEQCCQHIAEYKAWQRRCNDAIRKHRAPPPGPPEGTHPPFGEYPVLETVHPPDILLKSTLAARIVTLQQPSSSGRRRRGQRQSVPRQGNNNYNNNNNNNVWDRDWRRDEEGRIKKR